MPRVPWNKGKVIRKAPLRSRRASAMRLQVEGRTRDLAMFNLAIDSSFAAVMSWPTKVDDIAPPRPRHRPRAAEEDRPPGSV